MRPIVTECGQRDSSFETDWVRGHSISVRDRTVYLLRAIRSPNDFLDLLQKVLYSLYILVVLRIVVSLHGHVHFG